MSGHTYTHTHRTTTVTLAAHARRGLIIKSKAAHTEHNNNYNTINFLVSDIYTRSVMSDGCACAVVTLTSANVRAHYY